MKANETTELEQTSNTKTTDKKKNDEDYLWEDFDSKIT